MQANNDEDTDKGYISIEGGTVRITAGQDCIQAETTLAVTGGDITTVAGGGNAQGRTHAGAGWGPGRTTGSTTTSESATGTAAGSGSAKGLKAGTYVLIEGGAADAVHSNGDI